MARRRLRLPVLAVSRSSTPWLTWKPYFTSTTSTCEVLGHHWHLLFLKRDMFHCDFQRRICRQKYTISETIGGKHTIQKEILLAEWAVGRRVGCFWVILWIILISGATERWWCSTCSLMAVSRGWSWNACGGVSAHVGPEQSFVQPLHCYSFILTCCLVQCCGGRFSLHICFTFICDRYEAAAPCGNHQSRLLSSHGAQLQNDQSLVSFQKKNTKTWKINHISTVQMKFFVLPVVV